MANLVLNPDFENWNFATFPPSNWTVGRYATSPTRWWPQNYPPYIALFADATDVSLKQNGILTTDGVAYTLTFVAASVGLGTGTKILNVNINGTDFIIDPEYNSYTLYSIQFVAGPGTTTLEFYTETSNTLEVALDTVSITQSAICYRGSSKVFSKNILTGEIAHVPVKDINVDNYHVYSSKTLCFIPLKYNIITGPYNRFIKIKKDLISKNKPSEDLYITSGHRIVYNGKEIKAKNVPGSEIVKIEPEFIYSLCVEENQPIVINNIDVIAYGEKEWLEYSKKNNIVWYEN